MNWTDALAETSANLATFRGLQPETAKGFTALHRASMQPGAMDAKHKELIALAIGIATRCADCIGFHVRAAIKAGATRDEVAETVSVAVMMGGGPAYMYGAKAIEAFDQMST